MIDVLQLADGAFLARPKDLQLVAMVLAKVGDPDASAALLGLIPHSFAAEPGACAVPLPLRQRHDLSVLCDLHINGMLIVVAMRCRRPRVKDAAPATLRRVGERAGRGTPRALVTVTATAAARGPADLPLVVDTQVLCIAGS